MLMMDVLNRTAQQRIETIVRTFVKDVSTDRVIAPDEDLVDLGLTSMDMVNLLLAVEAEFDLTVPGTNLNPAHFRSITGIERLVDELTR
jgi:acyl carrier protein